MYVYVLGENQIQTDSIRSTLQLRDGVNCSEIHWKSSRDTVSKQGQREIEGQKWKMEKEKRKRKGKRKHPMPPHETDRRRKKKVAHNEALYSS